MSVQIHSTLEQVSASIFQCKNVEEGKQELIEYIQGKGIKEMDKKKMIWDISQIKSVYKLQYYVCNSLLKYEGLSLKR